MANGHVLAEVRESLEKDDGLNEKQALRLSLVMQEETLTRVISLEQRVEEVALAQSESWAFPSMLWLLWNQPRRFLWIALIINLPTFLAIAALAISPLREPILAAMFGS